MSGHPYCPHIEGEPCECATTLAPRPIMPPTNRPRPADERAAVVQSLAAQGLSNGQIAKRLGMTKRSVERLRRRGAPQTETESSR